MLRFFTNPRGAITAQSNADEPVSGGGGGASAGAETAKEAGAAASQDDSAGKNHEQQPGDKVVASHIKKMDTIIRYARRDTMKVYDWSRACPALYY